MQFELKIKADVFINMAGGKIMHINVSTFTLHYTITYYGNIF